MRDADPENEIAGARPLSRRDFLQTAGLGSAGLLLGEGQVSAEQALVAVPDTPYTPDIVQSQQFLVRFDAGTITSLKRVSDAFDTDYIASGRRLGEVVARYRQQGVAWQTLDSSTITDRRISSSDDGRQHSAVYADAALRVKVEFAVEDTAVNWQVTLESLTGQPLEIGDLAFPLFMNSNFRQQPTTAVLKHSFISGDGSFLFWMRRNSVGPYLTMTPDANTQLEYWESQRGGYNIFVHSIVAGAAAHERGTRWRQPNSGVRLAPQGNGSATRVYGFKLQWAADYSAVRQILVNEGLVDVQVVPGMTVPADLLARFALRTRPGVEISSVTAEFPRETTLRSLGRRGDTRIYEVRFRRLGENRLTVRFGGNRHMHLEFFSTEPVETLIGKRAAFIAAKQHRDPAKWYNGLLAEWALDTKVMLGPDNYDRIRGWRIYEVSCDDPGLSKPAFLAAKQAEFPVQAEVSALDYYIEHFVWGGLQRTTDEEYAYAIYGIPDWKQNRESRDPGRNGRQHFWRIYDYPHITLMYFSMYRVAKHQPQIRTALAAEEYLRRAYGTAVAMFTIPYEIERWSAYQTGLYNELVMVDLIDALEAEGKSVEAERLRMHWERKVRAFVAERPDLFRSEYAFDSTGFESTHALAKYALQHAQRLAQERPANERLRPIPRESIDQFMEQQMAANIFCRGSIEPAYYYLGSDYRGGAGDRYTLTYMSQMGGWSVLDYALHYTTDPFPYLRLGYASALSAWALMNTGTPESNYGYWYPGKENDGGAGGGFEPAPFGNTWLEQPHTRGSWYYSCEIDLGYCGALRAARTVLADDPIFGRFCFGGDYTAVRNGLEVVPRDGVRRRFHALINGRKLHIEIANARFARGSSIFVSDDLNEVRCHLENDNPAAHTAHVRIAANGTERSVPVSMAGGKGVLTFRVQQAG